MSVTLLVMTLNEIEGMKEIMPLVPTEEIDQIIVVDGGSTDGTVEWAEQNGYEVYIQKRKGFRHAYHEVWPMIKGDAVITFSPDGNSIPSLVTELIRKYQEGYEMVIASRYLEGAGSDDDDMVTSFGNWLFTKTVNILHRGRYTDAMVIYRIYDKNLPDRLFLNSNAAYRYCEKLFQTKISWEPLLSVRAAKFRCKISEIPGREPERIGGERKLQILRWGAAYYLQFIVELFMTPGKRAF